LDELDELEEGFFDQIKKAWVAFTDILEKKHIVQFIDYLKAELIRTEERMRAVVKGDSKWLHYDVNIENGILISILSSNASLADRFKGLFSNLGTSEKSLIDDFLNDRETLILIKNELTKYFNRQRNEVKQLVVEYNIVEESER
jgi:hypothetical protein